MYSKLIKKFTNSHKDIPLLYVMFDLSKYKENGEKGSCTINIHPDFKGDSLLQQKVNDLIDHIRGNYDMDKLIK